MLCLYLTIALFITGMLPVSLGTSFSPGLLSEHFSSRLHKREAKDDLPVPRAIAEDFTSVINDLAEAAHTQGAEGKSHRHEMSKIPGEPHKRFFHWIFAFLSGLFSGKIFRSGGLNDAYEFNEGMVIIADKQGPYCTGAQIKSWLVLTVVECIKGQEAKNLQAWVRITQNSVDKVPVQDIIVNPKYVEGQKQHGQAILIIFESKPVDTFLFPPQNFTVGQQETYVHDWVTFNTSTQMYISSRDKVQIAEISAICFYPIELTKTQDADLLYCCERTRGGYTYHSYEVGSPFYYIDAKEGQKYVVGLYNGFKVDEKMLGHVFMSIIPDLEWIEDMIDENPTPPKQKGTR